MKYAIITPTFEPHFQFVEKYLESYKEFVIDKENVTLLFIISKDEEETFKKITDKYCNGIKFETLFFEDILEHFGIKYSPNELLKKYKKYTFQTLKKFYTMLYSDADRFLVLDSESMWVRKTSMKELFENFFEAPFIASSSISCRNFISDATQRINDNVNFLLGKPCDRRFLENFVWFYDKAILNDMFQFYGTPIEMAEKVYSLKDEQKIKQGIFEIELYQTYLYHNNNKYNYTVLNVDDLLRDNLSSELLEKYLKDFYKCFKGNCGVIEHTMLLLNEANIEKLAKMFKKYHFNIIRCEYSSLENIKLQEKFINIVQPNILAASQEHAFGINDRYEILVNKNNYLSKLKKHLFHLTHPEKFTLQLLIEPFSVMFYAIKYFLRRQKNTKKYNELYGNNIKSEEISVVVQGSIHKTRTKKCLQSIRKNLPEAEIILSTWQNSLVDGLDFDILVLNEDPDAVQQKKFTNIKFYNNMNRMILSTNNGLLKAKRKYTLKLRTDCCIDNTNFLKMFDSFPCRSENYKLFEHRIIASTLFSKFAVNEHNIKTEIPFHVSDWWFFGLTGDVKKLLLSSDMVEEPYFSNYFEYPENSSKKSVFEKLDWRFAPEQYICYSCFSKYYEDIKIEDCSEISEDINKKSQICLANNFIFLEYKQSGIYNLKYKNSKYEPLYVDLYLDLYTFYNFELEYKKYCDSSYIPNSKNIILSDRILRFYKHLYKLFDPEAPLRVKIEQIFIGIPVSGITLIPSLFKILKEKR